MRGRDASQGSGEEPTPEAERQAAEYVFPYHHLPHIDEAGLPHVGRAIRGGLEYLAYLHEVRDIVQQIQPARLLDVGCGDGRLLSDVLDLVPSVAGVDLDSRAIAFAECFAGGADVRMVDVGDVVEEYDVVTCVETLEHIPDGAEARFLDEVAARVAPGGYLVITVPSTARPVHQKHHRHYSLDDMRDRIGALSGAWHVERIEEIVPTNRWLEFGLRLIVNRHWTLDLPKLNGLILRLHRRSCRSARRGLHALAVVRRGS